jgi:rRNA-processing protein FCF1
MSHGIRIERYSRNLGSLRTSPIITQCVLDELSYMAPTMWSEKVLFRS